MKAWPESIWQGYDSLLLSFAKLRNEDKTSGENMKTRAIDSNEQEMRGNWFVINGKVQADEKWIRIENLIIK